MPIQSVDVSDSHRISMNLRRFLAFMVAAILAATMGAVGAGLASAATTPGTTGKATVTRVIDGDTLTVTISGRIQTVRLIGLNAPEISPSQCMATQSRRYLTNLVGGRPVKLIADSTQADKDKYGRLLRHVVLSNGKVAAGRMIAAGMAKEYTYAKPYRYRSTFLAAQKNAKAQHRGIWSSACATSTPKTTPPPSTCRIKGNISSSGEKIYHVPGQRYYDVTIIDLSKGERWFCTEADAVAAGWRRSKV